MHVPQRKRPPPVDPSQLSRSLTPGHVTKTSAIELLRESVVLSTTTEHRFRAKPEPLPRVLWRYGQSIQALQYSVGRETSLPCSKSDIRACLVTALSMSHKAPKTAARLRTGYVVLEVFITDAEFEIVRELQDTVGDPALRCELSPEALQRLATCREGAGTPASAILMRIAGQMLARRGELGRARA